VGKEKTSTDTVETVEEAVDTEEETDRSRTAGGTGGYVSL